jgi:hypothetical protein
VSRSIIFAGLGIWATFMAFDQLLPLNISELWKENLWRHNNTKIQHGRLRR